MNCYKCATPLPDHSKFCMACGADVSSEGHQHDNTVNMEADPELLAALQADLGAEFVVERELGRGGMAIVYLGQDTHLGRKVAIKLLPPALTFGSGPGFIERFKREARTAATLDHPNIIPVYRVSTGGKLFWYVMKYLAGESLDVILKRDGRMSVERTVAIIAQVADALDYSHQNHVVHRDVKPANIMVDSRDRVTVTDFGIAKALEASGLTNSGATIGTPHYMSPEQCMGVGVTGAADQYSLAISVYHMLSGHLPFFADSVLELMRMHTMDPPPPLDVLRPDLPAGVVAAVERGLAKAAADRFPNCGDFASALAKAATEKETMARRPTSVVVRTVEENRIKIDQRRSLAPTTPMSVPAHAPPPKPEPKPRLTRRVAIATGALAAILVVGIFMFQRFRGGTSTGNVNAGDGVTQPVVRMSDPTPKPPTPEAEKTAAQTDSPAKTTPVPQPASLELRGVRRGATVTRDGQRVTGTSFDLRPGDTTRFVVSAQGFESWKQTFTPEAGQHLTANVALIPIRVIADLPETAKRSTAGPATNQSAPTQQPVTPRQSAPASVPAPVVAAPDLAYLTIGSKPSSSITINGRPAPSNPVSKFEVPAGRVVVRFQVTDSTGVWAVDTVLILQPGERRNVGFVPIRRP